MTPSDQSLPQTSYLPCTRAAPSPMILGLVAALLTVSLLAIGSIHPLVASVVALGSTGIFSLFLWRCRPAYLPYIAVPFLFLTGISLVQCIPIPLAILRIIAPDNADIWEHALSPLRSVSSSGKPLSLTPDLTWIEAAKWGCYTVLSWIGYAWAQRQGIRFPLWLALSLALLAGVSTLVHGALNLQSVFGVYTPVTMQPRWRIGPLLNANHLSGYLNLGAFAGLALLLPKRSAFTASTAALVIATSSLITGVVLLASRAAVTTLLLGAFGCLLLLYVERRKAASTSSRLAPMLLAVSIIAISTGLALMGYTSEIIGQLGERDVSKIFVFRNSIPLIKQHWIMGIGRGAFESVFPAYQTVSPYTSWSHPENIAIQWLGEWGIPVTLLAAGLFLYAIFHAGALRRSLTAQLLLLDLTLLILQNFFDYSLELPSVAALAAFLVGALCGAPSHLSSSGRVRDYTPEPRSKALPLWAIVALPLSLALLDLIAMKHKPVLLSDQRQQAYTLSQTPADANQVQHLTTWMRHFPAEPYFPLIGGIIAARHMPLSALPWYNRALERAPNMGVIHLALADALAAAGIRSQALLEVRIAWERDPDMMGAAAATAVRITQDTDELLSTALLDNPQSIPYLQSLTHILPVQAKARPILRQVLLDHAPCDVELRASVIRDSFSKFTTKTGDCATETGRSVCQTLLEQELTKLAACPGGALLADSIRAELLWQLGDRESSLKLLEQTCLENPQENFACLQTVAERAAELHDAPRVTRAVRTVVIRQCAGAQSCAAAWAWACHVQTQAGDTPAAYLAASKAVEADPSNLEWRLLLADSAIRVGARARAEAALAYVVAHRPEDKQVRQQLDDLRASSTPHL